MQTKNAWRIEAYNLISEIAVADSHIITTAGRVYTSILGSRFDLYLTLIFFYLFPSAKYFS